MLNQGLIKAGSASVVQHRGVLPLKILVRRVGFETQQVVKVKCLERSLCQCFNSQVDVMRDGTQVRKTPRSITIWTREVIRLSNPS